MKTTTIKKKVYRECGKYMILPIIFTTILMVLSELFLVFTGRTVGAFSNAAISSNFNLQTQSALAAIFFILATVIGIPLIEFISDFFMLKMALKHDIVVFHHFLSQENDNAIKMKKGEIEYILEDAPNSLRINMVLLVSKIIFMPLGLIMLLYNGLKINTELTFVMLISGALQIVIPASLKSKIKKYNQEERKNKAELFSQSIEIAENAGVVYHWEVGNQFCKKIESSFHNYYERFGKRYIFFSSFLTQMQEFFPLVVQMLFLLFGAIFVAQKRILAGQLAELFVYLSIANKIFECVYDVLRHYPEMDNAADQVCLFYQYEERNNGAYLSKFDSLQCEHLGFQVDGKVIFDNCSFMLQSKEKLCIIGKNGSGKTSLCKIICSMIKDYNGDVLVNGINMSAINIQSWRGLFSYADQSPYLFSGSIRENIKIGNLSGSSEQLEKIIALLDLEGLADKVVSMDSEISGGELQKISLGRAIIKDSPVIIMDEPTNHLDHKTSKRILSYIYNTDQTVIIVTHSHEIMGQLKNTLNFDAFH